MAGVNDTVTLDLRGVSNAFVQPGQPSAAITGTAGGINVVQYTDGTCNMASNFRFLQAIACSHWSQDTGTGLLLPSKVHCLQATADRLCIPFATATQICQAVPFVSVPAPNAVWTCGLQVRGNFTCSNGEPC